MNTLNSCPFCTKSLGTNLSGLRNVEPPEVTPEMIQGAPEPSPECLKSMTNAMFGGETAQIIRKLEETYKLQRAIEKDRLKREKSRVAGIRRMFWLSLGLVAVLLYALVAE